MVGIDEVIAEPGANRSIHGAMFEKLDTPSVFVVEPTVTAVEMQPGVPVAFWYPLLPDEITVETPTDRRLSMIVLRESESHVATFCPPPRLMLAETMLRPWFTTRS